MLTKHSKTKKVFPESIQADQEKYGDLILSVVPCVFVILALVVLSLSVRISRCQVYSIRHVMDQFVFFSVGWRYLSGFLNMFSGVQFTLFRLFATSGLCLYFHHLFIMFSALMTSTISSLEALPKERRMERVAVRFTHTRVELVRSTLYCHICKLQVILLRYSIQGYIQQSSVTIYILLSVNVCIYYWL